VAEEGKEGGWCCCGRKRIPDDIAVHSVIGCLYIKESNDWWAMMVVPVELHKLMKDERLVKSTTLWSETALGEINGR
jgi:hypothetical protein